MAQGFSVINEIVTFIIRDVSELPKRTSPSESSDVLLVTVDELRAICTRNIRQGLGPAWCLEINQDVTR